MYEDGAKEILSGCSKCGGHFFFYITEDKLKKIQAQQQTHSIELTEDEKESIEKDVREIIGIEDEEAPIVLDLESISIVKPGKYKIDVRNLFTKERPLIYKLEDGKYIVDLNAEFARTIKKG